MFRGKVSGIILGRTRHMITAEITGIVAGILTASATIPQLLKTYRTKDASDISLFMFTVLVAGLILWIVYGVMRSDLPIIATNVVAAVLNSIMIFFKFRFGRSAERSL